MPASTTALTVIGPSGSPSGPSFDEQASDVSPGNNFVNARGTLLYVRNTTVSAINVIIEADSFGAERTVLTVSIPGSGTEHGVKILGPFPEAWTDHITTTPSGADQGKIFARQATGSDGDLVFCPYVPNQSLAA